MSGLAGWLAGCVDADEALARDRLCVNCRVPVKPLRDCAGMTTGYTHDPAFWPGIRCEGRLTGAEPVHSPERALADVAFKRLILDMYDEQPGYYLPEGVAEGRDPDERMRDDAIKDVLREVLRDMAEVYKDRPGYQEATAGGLHEARDADRGHRGRGRRCRCAEPA